MKKIWEFLNIRDEKGLAKKHLELRSHQKD